MVDYDCLEGPKATSYQELQTCLQRTLVAGVLALGRRLRLPPLPSYKCLQTCGTCWMGVPRLALLPLALCMHCLQG